MGKRRGLWNICLPSGLKSMFNSYYIPNKVISKQAAIIYSRSYPFQVTPQQDAVIVSHFHQLLFLSATILPSLVYTVLPFHQ